MPVAFVRTYGDGDYVAYFTFQANGRWGVRIFRHDILIYNESKPDIKAAQFAANRAISRREAQRRKEEMELEKSL